MKFISVIFLVLVFIACSSGSKSLNDIDTADITDTFNEEPAQITDTEETDTVNTDEFQDEDIVVCENTCESKGDVLCEHGVLRTCSVYPGGCLHWNPGKTCKSAVCKDALACKEVIIDFRQWGSANSDGADSVTVDMAGNIFVTGTTSGALDGNMNAGGYDAFLTKWNPDGTKEWTKTLATDGNDFGWAVAIDSAGNIFMTGATSGSPEGNTNAGYTDIYLAKWNTDGTREWTRQRGTDSDDYGEAVAIDSSGNIFVTGNTEGPLDGNTCALITDTVYCSVDVFLTKWNADGTHEWTRQWGSDGFDNGEGVAIDSYGHVFVTGTNHHDMGGYEQGAFFLYKWENDGSIEWVNKWPYGNDDHANSVAVDSADNIFVAGYTRDSIDGSISAGGYDVFLMRYNEMSGEQK